MGIIIIIALPLLRAFVCRPFNGVSLSEEGETRLGGGDANGPILGHFILSQFRKGVSSSEGERAHLVSKLQGNTDG